MAGAEVMCVFVHFLLICLLKRQRLEARKYFDVIAVQDYQSLIEILKGAWCILNVYALPSMHTIFDKKKCKIVSSS